MSETERKDASKFVDIEGIEFLPRDDGKPGFDILMQTSDGKIAGASLGADGLESLFGLVWEAYRHSIPNERLADTLRLMQDGLREVARKQAQLDALSVPDIIGQTVPVVIEAAEGSPNTIIGILPAGGGSGLTTSMTPAELEQWVRACIGALLRVTPTDRLESFRRQVSGMAEREYSGRPNGAATFPTIH